MWIIIGVIGLAVTAFLFDRTCLWLERKGWLYYRKQKPQKGLIGTALQELNAQLLPSNRHVIAVKQNEAQFKKSTADSLGDIYEDNNMSNKFADHIKKNYDKIADIWYEKRDWHIEQASIDEAIALIKPGARILDVGCGSGKPIAAYLLSKGFDVYGLDISEKQIEYAKQLIPENKLFVADIFNFSTPLQFDAIVCWFTLFHIHASLHQKILQKLHGLLKSGGFILITFADTSHQPEGDYKTIDPCTIESEMFGERFYHSGQPAETNSSLMLTTGFKVLSDKIDQPGNQVVLARKEEI